MHALAETIELALHQTRARENKDLRFALLESQLNYVSKVLRGKRRAYGPRIRRIDVEALGRDLEAPYSHLLNQSQRIVEKLVERVE